MLLLQLIPSLPAVAVEAYLQQQHLAPDIVVPYQLKRPAAAVKKGNDASTVQFTDLFLSNVDAADLTGDTLMRLSVIP